MLGGLFSFWVIVVEWDEMRFERWDLRWDLRDEMRFDWKERWNLKTDTCIFSLSPPSYLISNTSSQKIGIVGSLSALLGGYLGFYKLYKDKNKCGSSDFIISFFNLIW